MKVILLMLCSNLLVFDQVYCQPTFGDFFEKIPEQLNTAWKLFMTVLRHPIKPKRLGTTGKLNARTNKHSNDLTVRPVRKSSMRRSLEWQYRMTTEPMTHALQPNLSQVRKSTTLQEQVSQRRTQFTTTKSTTHSTSSLDLPQVWNPVVTTTKKPKVTGPRILYITTAPSTISYPVFKYGSLLSDTMNRLRDRLKASTEETPLAFKHKLVIPRVKNPEPEAIGDVNQNMPYFDDSNAKKHTSAYKVLKYVYVDTRTDSPMSLARKARIPYIIIPY